MGKRKGTMMKVLPWKRMMLIGAVLLAIVAGYGLFSEAPKASGKMITVYKSPT
jgi:hypothetical protein